MFAKKKALPANAWRVSKVFLSIHYFFRAKVGMVYGDLAFLCAVQYVNVKTNHFAGIDKIEAYLGGRVNVEVINRLVASGHLERAGLNLYTCSQLGEYTVRQFETEIIRMTENRPRSKWVKIKDADDPRLPYLRPSNPKVKEAQTKRWEALRNQSLPSDPNI